MENVERFIVKPSIKLFGGVVVNKDTEFEVDNEDKTVHQTLKDYKLTTKIIKEYGDSFKTTESTELTQEVPDGQVLIWSEETGYIIPKFNMVKPEEAIKELEIIKDIK